MGWRTDWLYHCIFERMEKLWNDCQKSGRQEPPPDIPPNIPPEVFYIRQAGNANWLRPACLPPVMRAWRYDSAGLAVEHLPISDPYRQLGPRGTYYWSGYFDFHIAPNRKYVVLVYVVGPLAAEGRVYKVIGQGRRGKQRGRLEIAEGFFGWRA